MEHSSDPKENAQRARNISIPEVVTGKQPPDSDHEYGTVSPPPPSTDHAPRTEADVSEPKVRSWSHFDVFFTGGFNYYD